VGKGEQMMTSEEMEKTIQFLIDSQAKFLTDIERLKESQQKTDAQIQALAKSQQNTDLQIRILAENIEAQRQEMREAFEKLVMANEVTRELAVQIGSLVVQTSQRLARLEEQNGNP
jgi:DNA repair ATPase RecN